MALILADKGSQLMDGTEQNLFSSQTVLLHYSTSVFFDTLVAGDEILLRVYVKDEQTGGEKKYRTVPIEGIQINSATIVNWITTSSYRVTAQQITQGVGGFKTITWARYTN